MSASTSVVSSHEKEAWRLSVFFPTSPSSLSEILCFIRLARSKISSEFFDARDLESVQVTLLLLSLPTVVVEAFKDRKEERSAIAKFISEQKWHTLFPRFGCSSALFSSVLLLLDVLARQFGFHDQLHAGHRRQSPSSAHEYLQDTLLSLMTFSSISKSARIPNEAADKEGISAFESLLLRGINLSSDATSSMHSFVTFALSDPRLPSTLWNFSLRMNDLLAPSQPVSPPPLVASVTPSLVDPELVAFLAAPNNKCFRCGNVGHFAAVCSKNAKCTICGMSGHSSNYCRKGTKNQMLYSVRSPISSFPPLSDFLAGVFSVPAAGKKLWIERASLDGVSFQALIDTGSGFNCILKSKLPPKKQLKATSTQTVNSVSGELKVLGETICNTTINNITHEVTFLVFEKLHGVEIIVGFHTIDKFFPSFSSLVSPTTSNSPVSRVSPTSTPASPPIKQPRAISHHEYKVKLVNTKASMAKNTLPCNTIVHRIPVTATPPFAPFVRPYSENELKEINEYLDVSLESGVIEGPVARGSPWMARLLLVKQQNKKTRVVFDNPHLNKAVDGSSIAYPFCSIESARSYLHGAKYFTKLDFKAAYNQIAVDPIDRDKLCFSIPRRGVFRFKRLPFGLANAAASMQELVDRLFGRLLGKGIITYFDDLLIYASTRETLWSLTTFVLETLVEANINLNFDKCIFDTNKINYLSFDVTGEGWSPSRESIDCIAKTTLPKNKKDLHSFLGAANWYRDFFKNFSLVSAPLYHLIRTEAPNLISWSPVNVTIFEGMKDKLSLLPTLHFPSPTSELRVVTDASKAGFGGVLEQMNGGKWEPLLYFSKSTNKAQSNYPAIQLEALGIVLALEKFAYFLHGRKFTLVTDQLPLKHILDKAETSPMHARWFVRLQNFSFVTVHLDGKSNTLCDFLSRSSSDVAEQEISDFAPLCAVFPGLTLSAPCSWNEELIKEKCLPTTYSYDDDNYISIDGIRPVPKSQRSMLLNYFHDQSGHPATEKLLSRLKTVFTWPSISDETKSYCRTCHICQTTKGSPPDRAGPVQSIRVEYLFERVGFDHVLISGVLFLTVVEYFSRFPWIVAVPDEKAETTISTLRKIFSEFQFPAIVTHDRGPGFMSDAMKAWLRSSNISDQPTTAYHPRTNGLAERMNRTLIDRLKGLTARNDILNNIDNFLFSYRSEMHLSTGATPSGILFNRSDLSTSQIKANISKAQAKQKHYSDLLAVPFTKIHRGSKVLLFNHEAISSASRKTCSRWKGPFAVLSVKSNVCQLDIDGGKWVSRHLVKRYLDRNKRNHLEATVTTPPAALQEDEFSPDPISASPLENLPINSAPPPPTPPHVHAAPIIISTDNSLPAQTVTRSGRNVVPIIRYGELANFS